MNLGLRQPNSSPTHTSDPAPWILTTVAQYCIQVELPKGSFIETVTLAPSRWACLRNNEAPRELKSISIDSSWNGEPMPSVPSTLAGSSSLYLSDLLRSTVRSPASLTGKPAEVVAIWMDLLWSW